ncbi:alpha/beta hydrolase [Leuconostoc gelidum subsp. gelidum]|uniref:alpha/beta fold hydrolase n=1 Tax=Leuconostoc gelidum TaxID=1244 RepID=UPI001CC43D89|nr:alpha/beta hydrolase [Leuconostoc gelidum]MBZ6014525.1 alpha/beta hydrolase [Leuconostoc gelidum subsp. gelidum]
MTSFITSDKVKLSYTDQGNGQAVILLTGYAGVKEEWYYQSACLLERGFRVITLDWRCHGASTHTAKNLKIMRLAADLHELIINLKLISVRLIGHSMGGSVIWAYTVLFGYQSIDCIITIDESPKLLNDEKWSGGLVNLKWDNFWMISEQIPFLKMNKQPISTELRVILNGIKKSNPFDFDLGHELLIDHLLQDWRQVIRDIKVPQLFVKGACTSIWENDYSNYCEYTNNKFSKLVTLNNVGHMPQVEDYKSFNNAIVNFLKE